MSVYSTPGRGLLAELVAELPPRHRQLRRLHARRGHTRRAAGRERGEQGADLDGARRRPHVRHGRRAIRSSPRPARSRRENFDSATPLSGAPAPAAAGTQQSYSIPPSAQHYVAIRAIDEQGNIGLPASAEVNSAPALPTLGRCVKVGSGGAFTRANCIAESPGSQGAFEWMPGPGAKPKFSAPINQVILETTGGTHRVVRREHARGRMDRTERRVGEPGLQRLRTASPPKSHASRARRPPAKSSTSATGRRTRLHQRRRQTEGGPRPEGEKPLARQSSSSPAAGRRANSAPVSCGPSKAQ